MRLLEYEAKQLLVKARVPIPRGALVSTGDVPGFEGSFMLKCQIPAGGRGKAGGIVEVRTKAEADQKIQELMQRRLRGYRVVDILVEEKIDTLREFYVAVAYDSSAKQPVLVISSEGGIEVEQNDASDPQRVQREAFSVTHGIAEYRIRECVSRLGMSGELLLKLSTIAKRLTDLFLEYDATLVEVNPLALSREGAIVAVDCHVELDDDALFRHADLGFLKNNRIEYVGNREMTDFEKHGAQIDRLDHRGVAGRIIDFDGDLGLIIGGGGASLAAFDSIEMHGGKPANYCEVGGNPSVYKIAELTKLILAKPGVRRLAVISNVVSNTRVDLFARGVIKGIIESHKDPAEVVVVFRVPGAWEQEGYKILSRYGIKYCGREVSIDEAAKLALERA
jgi:succinyl-CoA synthetase beta subunit